MGGVGDAMERQAGGIDVATGPGVMPRLKADLAWASGFARLAQWRGRGAAAILHIERVRPARQGRLPSLQQREITPDRLDRVIAALKRWDVEIVSMDAFCARLAHPAGQRRFVCLSFNGVFHDVVEFACPVLTRHAAPFTVYVPSAYPDRLALPWWLALERVIASQDRINMVMAGRETRFDIDDIARKSQLYDLLFGWMRSLAPADLAIAIHDLCGRYGVDPKAVLDDIAITWDDIGRLAADPTATIGTATVTYAGLAGINDIDARREIAMGRAVLKAAIGRDIRHFAFPFGDRASFRADHVAMAAEAGFTSAVTTIPGAMRNGDATDLHALPRLTIDGHTTLRRLRAVLSGVVRA